MMGAVLGLTRRRRVPIYLRRKLAKWFIPQDGRAFSFSVDGLEYTGCLDNDIELMAYATGTYFEYTHINLVRQAVGGGIALDVGANVGNHALAFSQFFDQVFAIEPYPVVYERLLVKQQQAENISPHLVGFSDQAGSLRFASPKGEKWGGGKVSEQGDLVIDVCTGDDFVREQVRDKINFIKIDIEGHELPALRGLHSVITRDRPVVMFEIGKAALKNEAEGLREHLAVFPPDYAFASVRGQTTLPLQQDIAKVRALERSCRGNIGKVTYVLAFGPERGLKVQGRKLRRVT